MKNLLATILVLFLLPSQNSPMKNDDIDPLLKKAKNIALQTIIIDGHVDLPYRMRMKGFMLKKDVEDVSKETLGNFDYPKAKRGGLDAPFMSIYIPSSYQKGGAKAQADSLIDMVKRLPVKFPDLFAMANTPKDIETAFSKKRVALPLGMENGAPIENDLKNVKYFYDRGIRYITLTHSKDNQLCDSSYDTTRTWNGLSPFGKEVVKEMNKWGIMVDISHISDSSAFQVLELTDAPVIASHSSCRKFTPGWERNMSDEILMKLAENGGVIHINFSAFFLSKEVESIRKQMHEHLKNWMAKNNWTKIDTVYQKYAKEYAEKTGAYSDISVVADHIDHVVNLVGIDHVGFGSDFDGVGDSLPKGLKDVSGYPNLIYELLKRGYSQRDIEKICYKNTFRVWNQVIKTSKRLQQKG